MKQQDWAAAALAALLGFGLAALAAAHLGAAPAEVSRPAGNIGAKCASSSS